MGWTKRELILQAYAEFGMASYVYDIHPEQLEAARRSLDAMMGTWNAKGILVGYPMSTTADGTDLDDDANLPLSANETVYLNLAIRLAPGFGKTVVPDTKVAARVGYLALFNQIPPLKQIDNMAVPAGAGNRRNWYGNPFLAPPQEPLEPLTGIYVP